MNNFFKEEFTLCHRQDPFTREWKCECGFNTVKEVDYRANVIRELHPTSVTTFMPFYKGTPNIVQREIIRYRMTPMVSMMLKPKENRSD